MSESKNDRFTSELTERLVCERIGRPFRPGGQPSFDLDVAAHTESSLGLACYAPPPHHHRLGCLGTDGLSCPWFGHVWVNPPFTNLDAWVSRAWSEARTREPTDVPFGDLLSREPLRSISLICPTRTEQPWWHRLVEPFRDREFLPTPFDLAHPARGEAPRSVRFSTHFLPKRQGFVAPGGRKLGSPRWNLVLLHWRVTYLGEPT